MKAIGYIRVSTEEQTESGLSLVHQRAKVEAYAMATDIELVTVVEDAGKSAKNLNREGIQRALEMLCKNEAQALIILKLDRLTRSVKDLGFLVETFEKIGAALISVQDSINTKTAAGRLVLNVLGAVSQWEREAIAERTSSALQERRRQGKRAGTVPFGYSLATDGQSLILNAKEQEALRIMQELRGQGWTLHAVAAELGKCGFQPKTGKKWHPQTIKNLCEHRGGGLPA